MKIVSPFGAVALCALTTNAFATTYQSQNGYQITPPNGFIYRQGAHISYDTGQLRGDNKPFDSLFAGPHKETISVVVKSAPPQLTLPWLLQYVPSHMEAAMTSNNTRIAGTLVPYYQGKTKCRVLSSGYTTVGGAQSVTFLSRIEASSPSSTVLVRQVVVLRYGWAFTISCTAPAKTFWKMAPEFNRTLATIRWTK